MKKTAKKLLGLLLAVVLVAGMLPVGTVALAADEITEAITFVGKTSASSYIQVEDVDNYGDEKQNLNWKFFGWSGDWLEKHIRSTDKTDKNCLRLRAGPAAGAPCESWLAFEIDFQNEALTPGIYSLSMDYIKDSGYPTTGTGTASATFWFAEADSTISGENAESYKADANLIGTVSSFTSSNVISDVTITDPAAKYVLVVEFESDMRLSVSNFTFTRTRDLPTVELPTEETFDVTPSPARQTHLYFDESFNTYGDRNWRFLDTVSYLKDDANSASALANYVNNTSYLRIGYIANNDICPWTALVVKPSSPLKPGEYQLTFNSYSNTAANGASVSVFVAPYDSAITNVGDYARAENIAFSSTVAAGANSDDNTFVITDSADEYVFLIRLNHLTTSREIRLVDFKFSRKGDVTQDTTPSAETVTYGLKETDTPPIGNGALITDLDSYVATGRNWKFFTAREDYLSRITVDGLVRFGRMSNGVIEVKSKPNDEAEALHLDGVWHSFKLEAPAAAGIYSLDIASRGSDIGQNEEGLDSSTIWLAPYTGGSAESYMTDKNLMNSNEQGWSSGAVSGQRYISLNGNADELILLVKADENSDNANISYETITLTPVEVSSSELVLSKDTVRIGEKSTASLAINGEKPLMNSAVTYSKAGDAVEISEAGTITPVKSGEATITATCGDITAEATITVSTDELLSDTVSVAVCSYVDGVAGSEGIEATPSIKINYVNSVARRQAITLTATGIEGKEFKYWQSSSGVILSDGESYTFNANSNTAIFGVYESEGEAEDEADVTIRFFSGFGSFIKKVALTKGSIFADFANEVTDKDYRGYKFDYWKNADNSISDETPIKKNDVVVAQYAETPEKIYNVTGIIDPGYYAYDAVVTAESTDSDFSYWKRNGEIVSYNPTYTFSVWGDTDVEAVCNGATAAVPAVILDNDGDLYMTEYSLPEGCKFVEAGIVFSNSGTPSINSRTSKASSKDLEGLHGQFTARPSGSETVARGYVIYKDTDGDLVASYSKVK